MGRTWRRDRGSSSWPTYLRRCSSSNVPEAAGAKDTRRTQRGHSKIHKRAACAPLRRVSWCIWSFATTRDKRLRRGFCGECGLDIAIGAGRSYLGVVFGLQKGREQIARSLEILLDNPQLAFQEQDVVVAALRRFQDQGWLQDRRPLSFRIALSWKRRARRAIFPSARLIAILPESMARNGCETSRVILAG